MIKPVFSIVFCLVDSVSKIKAVSEKTLDKAIIYHWFISNI